MLCQLKAGRRDIEAQELEKYMEAVHRKTGMRADAPSPKQSKTTVAEGGNRNRTYRLKS